MAYKSVRTLLIEDYDTNRFIPANHRTFIENVPPQLLGSGTHAKLQQSIDKYNIINQIFTRYNTQIYSIYDVFKKLIYVDCIQPLQVSGTILNFDFCTGGSFVWNSVFKSYYDRTDIMSEYEKSAIHNTYIDLYNYVTFNNKRDFNLFISRLNDMIYQKVEELKIEHVLIANNLNNIQYNKIDLDNSTIFKIYLIFNNQGTLINCELLNIYLYNINHIDAIEDDDNDDYDGVDQKIVDLKYLKDENNNLNIYGLYIFNYISKTSRKPVRNDYDIYNVREQIFDKYILLDQRLDYVEFEFIDKTKLKILYYLLNYYKHTFKSKKLFDKYFIKNIKKKIFNETENIKIFENILRYYLIEKFRPYINFIILLINDDLVRARLPRLFAVGGDCCRRYKNDLSKTEDIDTKLYLDDKSQLSQVESIIVKRVNQLIAFFIVNKDTIINMSELLGYLSSNGYDQDYISIDPSGNLIFTYCDADKRIQHELTYYLSDEKSTFFRFRHSFSSVFPVDLYASDFQIKNKYKIYKVNDNFEIERTLYEDNEITFDMAYLDVSVDIIKDVPNIIRLDPEPNHVLSNNLPIGRLLFLIIDLINTYNNDESSIMRLMNGKNKKDYTRFLNLVKIFKAYLFTENLVGTNLILDETNYSTFQFNTQSDMDQVLAVQSNNKALRLLLDTFTDINTALSDPLVSAYSNYFVSDYVKRRAINKEKIIFNFDLDKLKKNAKIPSSYTTRSGRVVQSRFGGLSRTSYISSNYDIKLKKSNKSHNDKLKQFKKLKEIKIKENIQDKTDELEFKKLYKNEEFKILNKMINTPASNNKKILKNLLKSIDFNFEQKNKKSASRRVRTSDLTVNSRSL